jgi:hypothetical protein
MADYALTKGQAQHLYIEYDAAVPVYNIGLKALRRRRTGIGVCKELEGVAEARRTAAPAHSRPGAAGSAGRTTIAPPPLYKACLACGNVGARFPRCSMQKGTQMKQDAPWPPPTSMRQAITSAYAHPGQTWEVLAHSLRV